MARHRRVHGEWAFKSKLEEAGYTTLLALGFRAVQTVPAPGEFVYDQGVFADLVGTGGSRLRPDFLVRALDGRLLWVEVHGAQHYEPVCFRKQDPEDAARKFAQQQVHDQLKRDYATTHNIALHEVKYSDAASIPTVMALAALCATLHG
jgi:hypothetical protein